MPARPRRFGAASYHAAMTATAPTVASLLTQARTRIDPVDADYLLLHVLHQSRSWLFAHADDGVSAADAAHFEALVQRRGIGEPVAYLTGSRGFWTLDLAVSPATLIPRPETELLVEQALLRIPNDAAVRVADLGTGSGAIALALARERPQAQLVATDASADALDVSRGNAQRNAIGNVEFRQGDWLAPVLGERFDVIVSNPPYIAEHDPHLDAGDLRFEPLLALACGVDGLDAIRMIAVAAPAHLRAGGWLLLEHGLDQGPAVRTLLRDAGFYGVKTVRDLESRDRVTLGQR